MKNCTLIIAIFVVFGISSLGISSPPNAVQYSVSMVKDLNPNQTYNALGDGPNLLTPFNGKLYFWALGRRASPGSGRVMAPMRVQYGSSTAAVTDRWRTRSS